MGGTGSTDRKVSFGMDEEDRVRVLRGIRLSEDVVNRMKDSPKSTRQQSTSTTSKSVSSSTGSGSFKGTPDTGSHHHKASSAGARHNEGEEDLYERYKSEQATIQEELARLTNREREEARENLSSSILQKMKFTNEEKKKASHLTEELERKEAELKRLDAFHKEQLAQIEQKNKEIYKLSSEQFHTAATNAEFRVKSRSYDPVCMNLQSKILQCYQNNRQEILNCSELAKEYTRCVTASQKTLLNHG